MALQIPSYLPLKEGLFFPPVLWGSCKSAPFAFKTKHCGLLFPVLSTHRLGSLMRNSEFTPVRKKFYNILQFPSVWVAHPGGLGFDYITSHPSYPPILLWFLLYVFSCRRSFPMQVLSVSLMIVLKIVVILVCLWGGEAQGLHFTILATLRSLL